MGRAWTRDDWNAIIQKVNALIDNGCVNGVKLPEISGNHKWSVADVVAVRTTLTAMCANSPKFDVPTVKWTQAIIDELNAAIKNCQCQTYPYTLTLPFSIESVDNVTSGTTIGADGQLETDWEETWTTYYADVPIDGLQVGPPGISGRTYLIYVGGYYTASGTNNRTFNGNTDSQPWSTTQMWGNAPSGVVNVDGTCQPNWPAPHDRIAGFQIRTHSLSHVIFYPGNPNSWTVDYKYTMDSISYTNVLSYIEIKKQ